VTTIAGLLEVNARHHGKRTAVTSAGNSLSWEEMADRAARFGSALLRRGLQPGDRLALIANNCAEILVAYYASALTGVIVAPASTRAHPAELDRYYGDYLQPRAALLGPESEGAAGSWLDRCDLVVSLPGGANGEPFDDLIEEPADGFSPVDPDAPFTIGQTSGTTGRPKGAVITQRNAVSAILGFIAEIPIRTDDAYLIQHPMSNVPGGPGQ